MANADRDWSSWANGVASYSAADFQALVEAAMALADPARRQALLADILAAWLKSNPRSFNKYFMALEVANDLAKLERLVPALKSALTQLAGSIPSSDVLQDIVRRLVAHLARTDPKDALAWATTWLRGDTHDLALVQILRSLTRRDVGQAVNEVGKITSPLRRMQAAAAVGGAWAGSDAGAAASWASQIVPPTERAMTLNAIFVSIAQVDPADAASRLAQSERIMSEEYSRKYRSDLAALNLTEADLANDPEAYRELRNDGSLPPPTSADVELFAEAARVIASRLAASDPLSGVAWAESLGSEFLKLNAVKGALSGWTQRDPQAAVTYCADHYAQYGEILSALFSTWAASDPAAAAAGTNLLKSSAQRNTATESVARIWASADATKAAEWIDRLRPAERTDEARLAIATALTTSDPAAAWARGLEIGNPSLQYKALKSAFAAIVTADPNAARQLLRSAQLSARNAERLGELLRAVE